MNTIATHRTSALNTPTNRLRQSLRAVALTLMLATSSAFAGTITLDNSFGAGLVLDPTHHFLYAFANNGPGARYLDVINTQTNAVVGNYSFSGSGYEGNMGYSGTYAIWADQGDQNVRLISISGTGSPSLSRTDSYPGYYPTGMAALSTTYGVSLQGSGDNMDIVNISTGAVSQVVALGGVAGAVSSDPTNNLYYAAVSGANTCRVINLSGTIVRSLSGNITVIDPTTGHNYVYLEPGSSSEVLDQLNGADDSATGKSYDFGAGAVITDVAVDASTGNIWATLEAQNKVVELNSSMNLLGQYTVSNADAIAFDSGEAFVDEAGTNTVMTITATPEPGSVVLVLLGSLGLCMQRRSRKA